MSRSRRQGRRLRWPFRLPDEGQARAERRAGHRAVAAVLGQLGRSAVELQVQADFHEEHGRLHLAETLRATAELELDLAPPPRSR